MVWFSLKSVHDCPQSLSQPTYIHTHSPITATHTALPYNSSSRQLHCSEEGHGDAVVLQEQT